MNNINSKYLLAVLSSSVGSGFQHGYNYGVVNVAHKTIEQWIRENKKDRLKKAPSEKDIIFIWTIAISIFSIGGMLGSLMTAYFANRFGHKGGLVWNNCIMFLAAIFLFFAKAAKLYEVFILGRLLIGINAGLNSGLCPMYLAEIAPVRLRGSTTALYSFVVSVSLFVSQFFSLEATLGDAENWPTIFAIAVIPSLLQLVALWICPESPRFLFLTVDDEVKGQKALVWLRNKADIRAEVSSLIEHKTVLQQLPTASFKAMFKHSVYRTPLIICLTMVLSQQCCGIEATLYFSAKMLENAGLTPKEAQYASLTMAILLVVCTFGCVMLIDALGRRMLFLLSLCGMTVDTIFVAVVLMLSKDDVVRENVKIITASAVVLFAGWYALGTGTVPMVVTIELFNTIARPFAVSIVVPVSWLGSFIVSVTYLQLAEKLGYYLFVVYLMLDLFLFLFIHMYLPETKGKKSKDIIKLFSNINIDSSSVAE